MRARLPFSFSLSPAHIHGLRPASFRSVVLGDCGREAVLRDDQGRGLEPYTALHWLGSECLRISCACQSRKLAADHTALRAFRSPYSSLAMSVVPYTDPLGPAEAAESWRDAARWAMIRNPVPGRTLDEVYSVVGQVLQTHANRAAHRLGLGPNAVAAKITSYFGTGEDRQQRLIALWDEIPENLERYCFRLMEYTLPCAVLRSLEQAIHLHFHLQHRVVDNAVPGF
jgi:hypothetical protein